METLFRIEIKKVEESSVFFFKGIDRGGGSRGWVEIEGHELRMNRWAEQRYLTFYNLLYFFLLGS